MFQLFKLAMSVHLLYGEQIMVFHLDGYMFHSTFLHLFGKKVVAEGNCAKRRPKTKNNPEE